MIAHTDSPVRTEEVESPIGEIEAMRDPSPKHKGKHIQKECRMDETTEKHNLEERVSEDQQGEVQTDSQLESIVPEWLDKEIKRKQVVVEDTPPNWDALLAKIGKDKGKKRARVISKVEMDEAHNKFVHIATLALDKDRNDVVEKDYSV